MGFWVLLSGRGVDGDDGLVGVVVCGVLVGLAVVGGRWGPGPVARDVRAPGLALVGLGGLGLLVVAWLILWWWPVVGAGMPMVAFLAWMSVAAVLMVPIGLMGRDPG